MSVPLQLPPPEAFDNLNKVASRWAEWSIDESIDAWTQRLYKAAEGCGFDKQEDLLIRDQIVAGCRSDQLRRRLLQTHNIGLKEALQQARAHEAAEQQSAVGTRSIRSIDIQLLGDPSTPTRPSSASDAAKRATRHAKQPEARHAGTAASLDTSLRPVFRKQARGSTQSQSKTANSTTGMPTQIQTAAVKLSV
jgi:hypothetical protein